MKRLARRMLSDRILAVAGLQVPFKKHDFCGETNENCELPESEKCQAAEMAVAQERGDERTQWRLLACLIDRIACLAHILIMICVLTYFTIFACSQ